MSTKKSKLCLSTEILRTLDATAIAGVGGGKAHNFVPGDDQRGKSKLFGGSCNGCVESCFGSCFGCPQPDSGPG